MKKKLNVLVSEEVQTTREMKLSLDKQKLLIALNAVSDTFIPSDASIFVDVIGEDGNIEVHWTETISKKS